MPFDNETCFFSVKKVPESPIELREIDLAYELCNMMLPHQRLPKCFAIGAAGEYRLSNEYKLEGKSSRFSSSYIPKLISKFFECREKLQEIRILVESPPSSHQLVSMFVQPIKIVLRKFLDGSVASIHSLLIKSQDLANVSNFLSTFSLAWKRLTHTSDKFVLDLAHSGYLAADLPIWVELCGGLVTLFAIEMSLVMPRSFTHFHRVMNTNIDGNRKVHYALTAIKEVGRRFAFAVCRKTDVNIDKRAGELRLVCIEACVTTGFPSYVERASSFLVIQAKEMAIRRDGKIIKIRNNDKQHRYRNYDVSPVRKNFGVEKRGDGANIPVVLVPSRLVVYFSNLQCASQSQSLEVLPPIPGHTPTLRSHFASTLRSPGTVTPTSLLILEMLTPDHQAMRTRFEENVKGSNSATVHVERLPLDVTNSEIRQVISHSCWSDKKQTCYAIVTFTDVESAQKAVICLGGVTPRPKFDITV
uniref:Small ribosomal subunit protein uS13 n=1 Tax=Ditylenchus dipsaci TaxID=166011 RepID=A0A915EPM3_9BILA